MKNPKANLLRPDLPVKPAKPPKRLAGETHEFTPRKSPPIREVPRKGPEESHRLSVESQLNTILEKHRVFVSADEPWLDEHEAALIKDLLSWRRS